MVHLYVSDRKTNPVNSYRLHAYIATQLSTIAIYDLNDYIYTV